MEKLVSLHKHWLNADAVKHIITVKIEGNSSLPDELAAYAQMLSSFARISVLYGLIYVVIEGYKKLKYTDEKIDELLEKEDYVDALRLFRNATFHYQPRPISEKHLKFLELEESEIWTKEIHKAFRIFFEKNLQLEELLTEVNAAIQTE